MSYKFEGEFPATAAPKKAGESSQELKETKLVKSKTKLFGNVRTYGGKQAYATHSHQRLRRKRYRFTQSPEVEHSSSVEDSDSEVNVGELANALWGSTDLGLSKTGRFAPSPNSVMVGRPIRGTSLYNGVFQHDLLGRLSVTLKILRMNQMREATEYFKFPSHQNVIRRIAIGSFEYHAEPSIYIAMEDCCNQTLSKVVQPHFYRHQSLPFWSIQLAQGVKFLHDHGATLRNFKPDNILLSTDQIRVKIHDFGFNLKTSTESRETSTDWWSFEVPSKALDVFCLGLVFHFLWSDGNYAVAYDIQTLRHLIANGEDMKFQPFRNIPNPIWASSLLQRMLSCNPFGRPSVEEIVRHGIFSLTNKQLKDQCLGTEVSKTDAATDPVETDVYAKSGETTKYGNLNGGVTISKSITRGVGSQGKLVTVGGCFVIFPKDSYTVATPVTVTAEIDTSKWPKDFIGFTPTLYVDAPDFQGKARVKLPSWCANNLPDKIEARVLHLPHGSTEWEDIGATLPFTNEPHFEFEWDHFSPVLVGMWPFSSKEEVIEYRIAGSVYASDFNEVSIAYHVNNDLVFEKVSKRMASGKHSKEFLISLNPFTAKANEKIETSVCCIDPDNLQLRPEGPFSFVIDDSFGKELSILHHTAVTGSLVEEQLVNFECRVARAGVPVNGSYGFTHTCVPKTRLAPKRKRVERAQDQKQVNVAVNIAGDKTDNSQHRGKSITAQNYADNQGQVVNAQADTNVQMKKRLISAGESGESDMSDPSDLDNDDET